MKTLCSAVHAARGLLGMADLLELDSSWQEACSLHSIATPTGGNLANENAENASGGLCGKLHQVTKNPAP